MDSANDICAACPKPWHIACWFAQSNEQIFPHVLGELYGSHGIGHFDGHSDPLERRGDIRTPRGRINGRIEALRKRRDKIRGTPHRGEIALTVLSDKIKELV
jgi:hypothetical protein